MNKIADKSKKRKRAAFSPLKEEMEKKNEQESPEVVTVEEIDTKEVSPAFANEVPPESQLDVEDEDTKEREEESRDPLVTVEEDVRASDVTEKKDEVVEESVSEDTEKPEESREVEEKVTESPEVSIEAPEKKEEKLDSLSDFAPLEARETDLSEMEKKSSKHVLLLVIVAIISFGLGLGVSYAVGKVFMGQSQSIATASPTPTASSSATPSPTPSINRADITVEILNGSGIKGAAASAEKVFEDLGYTVERVGNADKSDYEESVVLVKSDADESLSELILSDIKDSYTASISATLQSSATVDVRFIVGKE